MTAMTDSNDQDIIDNAEGIIERFGGIRPMAGKMNVPVTTVQGWKKRNVIPGNRRREVMEAARSNNIDLSGLIEGAANENAAAPDKVAAPERGNPDRGDNVVLSVKKDRIAPPAQTPNDDMMAQIRKAQDMAITKSAWFTVVFVGAAIGLSAFLLWPNKQMMAENGAQVALLQQDVAGIKEQQSFLKKLIPDDLEQRFERVQDQTLALQDTVVVLAAQMDNMAAGVAAAPGAAVMDGLDALETGAVMLSAPEQLVSLLEKIKTLQGSEAGQNQLAAAVDAALGLVTSGTVPDEGMEQALQSNPALEQTLQGVSPQDIKAAVLLLGLTQFRDSMNRSAPFADDLALVQGLLDNSDPALQTAVERLAPQAEKGVLSPDGLKGEFKALAGDIVVASLKGEDVSVREKALARLNDVLQIEKDGALITGTDTQAVIARAQSRLDAGDIQGAITELQSLEGGAAETAAPWIDQARMTLTAGQVQTLFADKAAEFVGTGPGIERLIQEIGKLAPARHVYKDEASGVTILEQKPSIAP